LGEIKSTLDLIMERTEGMTLSREEKDNIRKEDLRKRAGGLKMKLMDAPETWEETSAWLEKESSEDRASLERNVWELLVEELPADQRGLKYLDLMEKLSVGKLKEEVLSKARSSLKSHLKNRGQERKKLLAKEKKKLASFGVSGTAVIPKIHQTAVESDSEAFATKLKRDLLKGLEG
jgi:hypothetical protein